MALHGKELHKLRDACAAVDSVDSALPPVPARTAWREQAEDQEETLSGGMQSPGAGSSSSNGSGSQSPVQAPRSKLAELAAKRMSPTQSRRRNTAPPFPAPEFSVVGGTYAEHVAVALATTTQGVRIRYLVEKLDDDEEAQSQQGLHTKLAFEGLLYRRQFVLDEYGVYAVHAMCVREDTEIEVSDVVSERFEIRATEVVPLKGKLLAELPKQMVRGFLRFAGATTKAIAPRLETVRRAIAQAAKTVEGNICVHLKDPKKGQRSTQVEVTFSIQVRRGQDGEEMSRGITDPSLVERVAEETGLSCKRITVESNARPLEKVLLHLAWTFPTSGRDYLDGSCLVYAGDRLLDVVDYRGAESVSESRASSATHEWSAGRGHEATVLHSGDVMSRTGGRHAIYLKLGELPDEVTECFFTLSAYICRNLSNFIAPRVCFYDADDIKHLLAEYKVEDAGVASAAVVCSVARHPRSGIWSVVAYGQTCDGTVRDYAPIEASIAPVQAKYGNWRRRKPILTLAALWHEGRALPRATAGREDVVTPLLELEEDLFRHVVSFL